MIPRGVQSGPSAKERQEALGRTHGTDPSAEFSGRGDARDLVAEKFGVGGQSEPQGKSTLMSGKARDLVGEKFGYIVSLNLTRRHLTTGQRAALAVAALPYYEEQAKERQGTRTDLDPELGGEFTTKSRDLVAEKFGVSAQSDPHANSREGWSNEAVAVSRAKERQGTRTDLQSGQSDIGLNSGRSSEEAAAGSPRSVLANSQDRTQAARPSREFT